MSKPRSADTDAELFEAAAVPATTAPPPTTRERLDVIEQELIAEEIPYEEPPPRTLRSKLFGIGFSGYFQLVVICIVAGAILQAGGVDFFSPRFSLSGLAGSLFNGAMKVLGWALERGWQPLLAGGIIVVPLWLFWRLLTVPFRH